MVLLGLVVRAAKPCAGQNRSYAVLGLQWSLNGKRQTKPIQECNTKVRTWSILDETVLILQMAGLVARLGLDCP